jgi:hypothetical protein
MALPSHPWKQTLERKGRTLQDFSDTHRLTGVALVKLEETVVLGCYAIRSLINGFILPAAHCHQPFPMTVFPRRHQSTPVLGDEPLVTRYDLDAGRIMTHDLMFLCHQVLQNCIFEPWLGADHRLKGVYITSDHQRKVALYGVGLSALSDLFLRIGADTTHTT